MRSATVLLGVVLLASPLFAATVSVQPAAPTSATPVALIISEFVTCGQVLPPVRNGNRFAISVDPGICLSPPFLATFEVSLGRLEPGDYEVVVTTGTNRSAHTSFFVSDADAKVFVLGQNIGSIAGGSVVRLFTRDTPICYAPSTRDCPIPTVTFNGVAAQVNEERFRIGEIIVTTPPNTPGTAEVVIRQDDLTARGRAFRYFDPAAAPLSSMFERVLFPLWFSGPGAFGSNWITERSVYTDHSGVVNVWRDSSFGPPRLGGVLYFPPRSVAANLHFGLLVRDTSRQAESWGTEIPVVRESEFRTGNIELLNVPVQPRFRNTLRIYNVDSFEGGVVVAIYAMDGRELVLTTVDLRSNAPCARFEPCASDDPAFAVINNLAAAFPQIAGEERVRVQVRPNGRGWAFISITNNDTQQVTTITPQ